MSNRQPTQRTLSRKAIKKELTRKNNLKVKEIYDNGIEFHVFDKNDIHIYDLLITKCYGDISYIKINIMDVEWEQPYSNKLGFKVWE